MITKNSKIYLAGHNGLLGSAIFRLLKNRGYKKIVTVEKKKLDLRDQAKVKFFFKRNKFDAVIIAAAKVGGINSNNVYPANFIYDNLSIQTNVIHSSYENNIKNLIFFGSSCIYPKNVIQPIKESSLLTGKLEETNEPYAVAKIAGLKMCQSYNKQYNLNYKCLMPSNIYGPKDNYNLETGHFFSALIKKIYLAKVKNKKIVSLWGSGKPKRELTYVDDVADACIFFLKKRTKETLINIGSGFEKSIKEYAEYVRNKLEVNYLKFKFDRKMPDGILRKIVDNSIARKYNWKSQVSLEQGFRITYNDFLNNLKNNLP